MAYTVDIIKRLFKKKQRETKNNPHYASEVKPLFDEEGNFNPGNWCSGQDLIRLKLYENELDLPGNSYRASKYQEDRHDSRLIVIADLVRDEYEEWYFTINIINIDTNVFDTYISNWYKGRGCTHAIRFNGEPITIDQYVKVLNILEDFNFFTDLEAWQQECFIKVL